MEAVSKIYLKLRYYFKLWRLNLDLKSVSEDACLRSKGKSFHIFSLCPERPKGDQNAKFTTPKRDDEHPVCFIWESPAPGGSCLHS